MIKLVIVMGSTMISFVVLQIVAYIQYRKAKQRVIRVLSETDKALYAGKHVMVNKYCGSVVIAENTPEEAYAKVHALNRETRARLISAYVPRVRGAIRNREALC